MKGRNNRNQWVWLSSGLLSIWFCACGVGQTSSDEPGIEPQASPAPQASEAEILANPQKEVDAKASSCQKLLDCLMPCRDQACAEKCVNEAGGVQNIPGDCAGVAPVTSITSVERTPGEPAPSSGCTSLCDCIGKCSLQDTACFKACVDKVPNPGQGCICPISRIDNPPPTTNPPVTNTEAPPRAQAAIEQVVHAGSGCPQGTKAELRLSDDLKALEVRVDPFTAQIANGGRMGMKFCTVSAVIKVPAGYTLSMPHVEAAGRAELEAGATGELHAGYGFAFGAGGNPYGVSKKDGAFTGDLGLSADFPRADLSSIECGKTSAILHTRLRALVRSDAGKAGKVQAGGLVRFNLQWAKCP